MHVSAVCVNRLWGSGRGMVFSFMFQAISSYFFLPIYNNRIYFKIELPFMNTGLLGVACLQLDDLTKLHTAAV